MITMLYAGLCTILVVFLAIRVVLWRFRHKIGLGDGGDRPPGLGFIQEPWGSTDQIAEVGAGLVRWQRGKKPGVVPGLVACVIP